ncbi:hypothetical protein SS1G_13061 [Sclerotinia sclerotiorum 1980 UF-70]|uniref:Pentatricopeptide repeat protein n=2 Tax=Sclerotinia sclerotiorum (strain ATCC 18683 / 1980 / Ss-1) TaxID=665079 RepID=A7F633_SCLS1|nr:hypothetical protein SS1G_13061 [Sclerotinia sclerotiorum 1980 UF-70]APA07363.1 hypothetical protein sscle_02g021330 [Sclerotinia sclerotiorum 1980 UF-70]EDN98204.1 hypothetical protein SS1G_13061 [Sclerotinia sclerotiorum 1980 UF-70]
MPSALPVPSKGALRALRNIALGTSCTVAFSTGMLTEDRRRRIHGAKLVHDNAKKLKSSRHYHESSSHLAETFEEQVLRYKDDGFWQAGSTASSDAQSSEVVLVKDKTAGETTEPVTSIPPSIPFKPPRIERLPSPKKPDHAQKPEYIDEDRQLRLANDIQQILGEEKDPTAIGSALRRFSEAFEEGLDTGSSGMQTCLLEAAIVLSTACRTNSMVDKMEKILDIVLKSTTLSESDFKRFEPHIIIESLLKNPNSGAGLDIYLSKLRKASALCLMEFKEKPGPLSNKMRPVLVETCNLTCRFDMFDLTKQLFWRIEATRGKTPNHAIGSFIIAEIQTKQFRNAVSQFLRYFIKSTPSQEELYRVTDALFERALELKHFARAEQILIEATKLIKSDQFTRSNNWFQKLLGTEWRRKRNIRETQERFDRLKTAIPTLCRPQAAYAVIIQLCVEAGDFGAAGKYHEQLFQISGSCEDDILIRGQIARGKAMCEEWDDVKANFAEMAKLNPRNKVYGDIFPPILKLYAKSHSVAETEKFLRCFLEQYQVPLTPYASNIMIGEYAKAKELSSILRWIEYATSVSTCFDADSFNNILSQLYKTWDFNFEQVYEVHRAMLKSSMDYTNDFTLAHLRQLALKDSKGNREVAAKKLRVIPRGTRSIMDDNYPRRQIFEEMGKGSFEKVVDIYKAASSQEVYIHGSVLAATVKASLHLNNGDSHMAIELLREAKRKGYALDDAFITLLTHRLPKFMESAGSSRLIMFLTSAREAIAKAEDHGLTITENVFNEVTNILVKNAFFRDAIVFWTEASRTHSATVRPNVVSLTILLKAYIAIKDPSGIIWITKMLSIHQIIPDGRMRSILKNTRQILRKRKLNSRQHEFLQAVEEAFVIFAMMRENDYKEKINARSKTLEIMERAIATQKPPSEQEINNWDDFEEESLDLNERDQSVQGPIDGGSF